MDVFGCGPGAGAVLILGKRVQEEERKFYLMSIIVKLLTAMRKSFCVN